MEHSNLHVRGGPGQPCPRATSSRPSRARRGAHDAHPAHAHKPSRAPSRRPPQPVSRSRPPHDQPTHTHVADHRRTRLPARCAHHRGARRDAADGCAHDVARARDGRRAREPPARRLLPAPGTCWRSARRSRWMLTTMRVGRRNVLGHPVLHLSDRHGPHSVFRSISRSHVVVSA
jgi:hypothetical protein